MNVRPLKASGSVGVGAMCSMGFPAQRRTRAHLEFTAIGGGAFPGGGRVPEEPRPGRRALYTALLGVERSPRESGDGSFASIGAGLGRHKLDGALGDLAPPFGSNWLIPSRRLTAFAVGASIGYRAIRDGPSLRIALRAHGMFSAGEAPVSSYLLTFGLAIQ